MMLSTASSSGPPSSAPIQSSHSFDSPHELAASVLLLAARGYDRKRILEHVSNSCRESDMKDAAAKKLRIVSETTSSATVTTTTTTTTANSECSVLRPCTSESDQDHGHEEDDDHHHHSTACQVSPVSHGSSKGAISPDRSQHSRSSSYDANIVDDRHVHLKDGEQHQNQASDETNNSSPALPPPLPPPPTNSPTGPPALSNTATTTTKEQQLTAGPSSSPLLEAAMVIENAANMAAQAAAANNAQQHLQLQHNTTGSTTQYPTHTTTSSGASASSGNNNNHSPASSASRGGAAVATMANRSSYNAPPASLLVEGVPPSHLPAQLYNLLQEESRNNNVLQWLPDGKAWRIVRWDALRKQVLPKYFNFLTVDSFLAQLTEWGFCEIQNGPNAGAYQHAVRENIRFGKFQLCICCQTAVVTNTRLLSAV